MSSQRWTGATRASVLRAKLREIEAHRRAETAKDREIKAHRRAITVHEDAVILFDRFHQTEKSRAARQRGQRAREMLRLALVEQAKAGGLSSRQSRFAPT